MNRKHALRASIVFAALLGTVLVAVAVSGYTSPPKDVTLDDPANQTISTEVEFTNNNSDPGYNPTFQMRLENDSGIVTATSISASNETTKTLTLDTTGLEPGVYEATYNSTDLSRAQPVAEPSITTTAEAYIENTSTDTLGVDLAFNGSTETGATVTVETQAGVEIIDSSVTYDPSQHSNNEWTKSFAFNESDGLNDGNLTVRTTVDDASVYDGLYVSDSTDGNGLLAGTIGGQDTKVALAGLAVIAGIIIYVRRED